MKTSWAGSVIGLLLAAAAQAAEPAEAQAERQRIKSERAVVEAAYKQAEADCRRRFAVSGCITEAQTQRREAQAGLRQRELVLDEAKRKAEAEEDQRRIEAKRAEAASKPSPVPRAASAPAKTAAAAASVPLASGRARGISKTGDDATEAAARVAAQQRRLAEAAAHRQEVEQRNAERAARGKKSSPLPVPSAAGVADIASAPVR